MGTIISQYGIEKYIDKFFFRPGFFLEIGSWHGELISQSAYLERERGWHGLCVDPFPSGFENRTCQVCSKAISKDGEPRSFIKVTTDKRDGGDVSYFSGFKDSLNAHANLIKEHCNYIEVQVETITFEQLYKQFHSPAYIEFLSVDVEGAELEIFESIDFGKSSYGLIVYEHNGNIIIKKAIGKILEMNGYKLNEELPIDEIWINKNLVI